MHHPLFIFNMASLTINQYKYKIGHFCGRTSFQGNYFGQNELNMTFQAYQNVEEKRILMFEIFTF